MIAFLAAIVGPKLARPVLIGLAVLLCIAAFATFRACTRDTTAERQAEQTSASGDAIANAAADAIETIGNRTVNDAAIDAAVADAQEEINNAGDPDTMRDAVLRRVCGTASHRNDAACAVR